MRGDRDQDSCVGEARRREGDLIPYMHAPVEPTSGAMTGLGKLTRTTRARDLQRRHMFYVARRQDPGLATAASASGHPMGLISSRSARARAVGVGLVHASYEI